MILKYLKHQLNIEILLILMVSCLINAYGVGWGLPSFLGWAIDEVTPHRVLWGASQLFSNGWYDVYPPFHYYVLSFLYAPFILLDKLEVLDVQSLPIYTILFYLGRFVSVFMGTAIVYITYLCGLEIGDRKSALFAAIITALNSPFVYYSKTVNIEVPYIFWFILSLFFYIRLLKHQRTVDYVLFSATAVTAICTKDQAYGFYVLVIPVIIFSAFCGYFKRHESFKEKSILKISYNISLAALVGILLFVLYHNLIFNWQGFVAHVQDLKGPSSYGSEDFFDRPENNMSEHLKLLWRFLLDIRRSLSWPISLVCLAGLAVAALRRNRNYILLALLIPAISYYLFFLSIILYSRDRFIIPICIILSLFAGVLISEFLDISNIRSKSKVLLISLLIFYAFLHSFSVNLLMAYDSRYYVESWMQRNIPDNAKVVSIGLEQYLPRFEFQPFQKPQNLPVPLPKDLQQGQFDYVITTSSYNQTRFLPGTESYQAFNDLNTGKSGYQLVLQHQSRPPWNFMDVEAIPSTTDQRYLSGNLNKINPEIKIFQRIQS